MYNEELCEPQNKMECLSTSNEESRMHRRHVISQPKAFEPEKCSTHPEWRYD